ncbi:MAG TPA: hypothetical protein VGI45_15445, partial [Terracidiphilus sp.]
MVAETPPPFRQSECEINPCLWAYPFDKQDDAGWCKQAAGMPHGAAQISGGVQHIGSDNDVELSRLKALRARITLDIESPILKEGAVFEFVLCTGEKCGRDVCIAILCSFRRQDLGDPCCRGSCTGPDLKNAQLAARSLSNLLGYGRSSQAIEDTKSRGFCVESLRRFEGAFAEEQLQGIGLAAENFGKR